MNAFVVSSRDKHRLPIRRCWLWQDIHALESLTALQKVYMYMCSLLLAVGLARQAQVSISLLTVVGSQNDRAFHSCHVHGMFSMARSEVSNVDLV
jgi:hypothetical protein